jgi:hypothetical protein
MHTVPGAIRLHARTIPDVCLHALEWLRSMRAHAWGAYRQTHRTRPLAHACTRTQGIPNYQVAVYDVVTGMYDFFDYLRWVCMPWGHRRGVCLACKGAEHTHAGTVPSSVVPAVQ